MIDPVIRTSRLTRYFGNLPVVRDLDIAIPAGQVTALLGLNSAKSWSTMRCMATSACSRMKARYVKLVYQPCPRCDKPRRIDTMVCGGCGADWDRLPRDGNEVISGWLAEKVTQAEHSA